MNAREMRALTRALRRGTRRSGERLTEMGRRVGLTLSGQTALGAAVALWLVAIVVAGRVLFVVAYGIVILLVLGRGLAGRRPAVDALREGLYERVMEGERLDIRLEVTARRRLSTVVLEERLGLGLGNPVRTAIDVLPSGETLERQYTLRPPRRGAYRVGPLVAVSDDPIGLTRRERTLLDAGEVLVHPRVEPVPERLLSRQLEDPPVRPPTSRPWPSGLEFHGMREYVPGDDLRRIVWRASARHGRIMVREAEQGLSDRVTLLLDTQDTVHSDDGPGLSESFESTVRIAASVGVRHLLDGYEVTTLVGGGALTSTLRGVPAQIALLDALARVQPGRDPLGGPLTRLIADPRRDDDLVVITPVLADEDAVRLRMLVDRGVSVLVVAVLWSEASEEVADKAMASGCRVVGVRPGDDLAHAFGAEIGAGTGR